MYEFLDPQSRLSFSLTNQRHRGLLRNLSIRIDRVDVEELLTTLQRNPNFSSQVQVIAVGNRSNLEKVYFTKSFSHISKFVEVLVKTLRHTQVQGLNLSYSNISPEGGRALTAALPRTLIQTLNLSNNNLGRGVAVALAAALPMTEIQKLDLSYNKMGPEGVSALAWSIAKIEDPHTVYIGQHDGFGWCEGLSCSFAND